MKLNLLVALLAILCAPFLAEAQTINFTFDNLVINSAGGSDDATTSETVGGVVYEMQLSITPASGNILTDDIGGGDLLFAENSSGAVTIVITADGAPLTSFDLANADVDAVGTSDYEYRNNSGDLIFAGSTVNGTVRTDAFSMNNTGISSFTVNATNDNPGFHNIVINNPTILPVELVSFTGRSRKDVIDLEWRTFTELDNDYFSIQKSADGTNFREIATERGAGTSYEARAYDFVDERPFSGTNYYRLQQTDYDGLFSYSEIIAVDFSGVEDISLAPNPVGEMLTVRTTETWKGSVSADVFGANGQLFKTTRFDEPNGSMDINTSDLKPGSYFLRLRSGDEVVTRRFVKQ